MQIHQIKRENPNKRKKTIGRGGKRGTTSGRGTKGQLARSGRKLRPEFRDTIKKIPKLRGYRFGTIQEKVFAVNVSSVLAKFNDGDIISPKNLLSADIIETYKGRMPRIKILGNSEISKKLNFENCSVSKTVKNAIEKAGGTVK